MNNKNPDSNNDSAMINAALEMLTSSQSNTFVGPTDSTNNSLVPEAPLDWRLEVSQTERYQVIQRLCQELALSVPQDQKNDSRISQIAQQIEKRFFDSSNSKVHYFTSLKSQILDIQRKASNKSNNQQIQPSAGSNAGSPGALSAAVMSGDAATIGQLNPKSKNMTGAAQPKQAPVILTLSEQDKNIVKDKFGQIAHLFPKISGLINTIYTLGTKSDMLQIHKLINIKKAIYFQLEGLKIDRYTISAEAASSLQSTLARYFHYGSMLIKQNEEKNAQLQLMMDKNDPKAKNQLFHAPSPQMQPNTASASATPLSNKSSSPYVSATSNITPIVGTPLAGQTLIMPHTSQPDQNALKMNAHMKQQMFIQKINQKQAQARQNAKAMLTQQDLDFLIADNSATTSDRSPRQMPDQPIITIKEDDFSQYFNFEDFHSPEVSPTLSDESTSSRKRKGSEADSESSKKLKLEGSNDKNPNESPQTEPFTLLEELKTLEHEFNLTFETTDLDSLDDNLVFSTKTMTSNGNQLASPRYKRGKTLVFCFLPNSTLRFSFRLTRPEYEEAVLDRNSRKSRKPIIQAEYFEKFRHHGCGLEEVEVVADQTVDYYDDIIKIHSFATEIGVGISGNMVQISDILRYTFDNVLKNKN